MPFNATTIIAIVALFLGIAAFARSRRIGPVITIAIGAFVLIAMTDQSFLGQGGDLVKKLFGWIIKQIHV